MKHFLNTLATEMSYNSFTNLCITTECLTQTFITFAEKLLYSVLHCVKHEDWYDVRNQKCMSWKGQRSV